MVGVTPTGVFHLSRLRLNRPELIVHRQQRHRAALARQNQERLLSELRRLEGEVKGLIAEASAWQLDEQ